MQTLRRSRLIVASLVFLGAGIFLWLSLDGRHYWHEARFIYAATQFTVGQLLSGEFNPHQVGSAPNELAAGGFYASKVLHILLLKGLFAISEPPLNAMILGTFLSVVGIIVTAILIYDIFRRLTDDRFLSIWASFCFFATPLAPYLAGKFLSEVPALIFIALAIWTFTVSLEKRGAVSASLLLLCGALICLTALARLDMILGFVGFYIAGSLRLPRKDLRNSVRRGGALVGAISLMLYMACVVILGVEIGAVAEYFVKFIDLETKSILNSVLGVACIGGVVFLVATAALARLTDAVTFLIVWFASITVPLLIVTSSYMIEPRYFGAALIPLAGLGGIGVSALRRAYPARLRGILVLALVALLGIGNFVAIKLMPYEIDRYALLSAIDGVYADDDNAVVLLPWAYSDFHFLSVMFPERKIYNVNTPVADSDRFRGLWDERYRAWYGDAYLDDLPRLQRAMTTDSTYYIGWRKYPPLENMIRIARSLHLSALAQRLEAIQVKDHRTESWVWGSPSVELTVAGKVGQYETFRVTSRTQTPP